MKKINILALFFGGLLLFGTTAFANSDANMKCGAGKCGANMQKPSKDMEAVQDSEALVDDFDTKASSNEEKEKNNIPQMKCGAGKCGSSMK